MPAFTFEKISPPDRPASVSPRAHEQRGGVVQILGRFVETRVRRAGHGLQNHDTQTRGASDNFDRRAQTLPK